jgi:hypothetical protein
LLRKSLQEWICTLSESFRAEAFMQRERPRRRSRPLRQRSFEFLEQITRRERWFKFVILALTVLACALAFAKMPRARARIVSWPSQVSHRVRRMLRVPIERSEVDDQWRQLRARGIAECRQGWARAYENLPPSYQRLMRYAGLDPDHGLLRWGNFDRTFLLPRTTFEADASGRSYRLRPCVESIWLRELTIQSGVHMFFLVPDRPDLRNAIRGTTGIPVEQSRQTTNTWGLRGPEPDPSAPLRGIILGDSFMQGLLIGDQETPPECLKRRLERDLNTRVSILNTGHLGYSPEQYYYSLVEFADRFPPHFVVVSLCSNDFGDLFEVLRGKADWEEGKFWLNKIKNFCAARSWPCLFVSVPFESEMLGRRRSGYYPGPISNILEASAMTFLDPTDEFINAHLALIIEADRRGLRPYRTPLFNNQFDDGHYSALGSEVWAEAVGRRVRLLVERTKK